MGKEVLRGSDSRSGEVVVCGRHDSSRGKAGIKGLEETKKVMARFEERNNNDKEEVLDFGAEGSGGVRMLGSWLGWKEDVNNRLKRAGKVWGKLKGRLIGSRMSKKMQARVVETCGIGAAV